MKLKKLLIIALIAVSIIGGVFIFISMRNDETRFNIADLEKIQVSYEPDMANLVGFVSITNQDDIKCLLACVKKVKSNNKKRLNNVLTAPRTYTVTYYFKNGETRTVTYKTYPSRAENNPFKDFFKLDSVIKQAQTQRQN